MIFTRKPKKKTPPKPKNKICSTAIKTQHWVFPIGQNPMPNISYIEGEKKTGFFQLSSRGSAAAYLCVQNCRIGLYDISLFVSDFIIVW